MVYLLGCPTDHKFSLSKTELIIFPQPNMLFLLYPLIKSETYVSIFLPPSSHAHLTVTKVLSVLPLG